MTIIIRRKFLFVLCALIICLSAFQAEAANTGDKVRLGVLTFLSRTEGVSADQAAAVGDIFARMLTSSKTITVIEREQLDRIASEHEMSMSGSFTEESAVQIGKIAGCQYMALGAVTRYEHSGSTTDLWLWGTKTYDALATIDVRIVNVATTEVILSLSETGTASHKGTTFNFYGMNNQNKMDFRGLESGAIGDAAARLSYKVRDALTGEHVQVLDTNSKEVTLGIGVTGGAQLGGLFRVYVDGEEIRDVDGTSLGRKMNDIAVVKIVDVQRDFSIAHPADKGAGNIKLIRRGDKIYPITKDELQSMIKRKAFPKARPKEIKLDKDLEDFLKR